MTIATWLQETSAQFANALIPSAGLDAEILLAHTLNKPRTWLRAHPDDELDGRRANIADARAQLRLERVPIAYIIGHKEFYGRRFFVTPDTLIPRPESEHILELLDAYLPATAKQLVDIGTGSGCLGITTKLEHPELTVTLVDVSKQALKIAKNNAASLDANVRILESNLLDSYPLHPDVIIANLPYVDQLWTDQSPELKNEPSLALYADDGGLALIKELIMQAASSLREGGLLLLEADPRQFDAIVAFAAEHSYTHLESSGFVVALTR